MSSGSRSISPAASGSAPGSTRCSGGRSLPCGTAAAASTSATSTRSATSISRTRTRRSRARISLAEQLPEAEAYERLAVEAAARIADPDDREHFHEGPRDPSLSVRSVALAPCSGRSSRRRSLPTIPPSSRPATTLLATARRRCCVPCPPTGPSWRGCARRSSRRSGSTTVPRGGEEGATCRGLRCPGVRCALALPGRTDLVLERRLGALGRGYRGWAAFWVHDLTTGRTPGWNSDARFPAASTVKLGVLVAGVARGLAVAPERSRFWYDLRQLAGWSSNLAANRLLAQLGTSRVASALGGLGMIPSTYPGPYRVGTARLDAPKPPPLSTWRYTTARDLGRALYALQAAAVGEPLPAAPDRSLTRARASGAGAAARQLGRRRQRRPRAPVRGRRAGRAEERLDLRRSPDGRGRLRAERPEDRRRARLPAEPPVPGSAVPGEERPRFRAHPVTLLLPRLPA